MHLEVHGGGVDLHMLGAMVSPGRYDERGLLHPFIDDDATTLVDPMDAEGNAHISQEPGLGLDVNWEYINANRPD